MRLRFKLCRVLNPSTLLRPLLVATLLLSAFLLFWFQPMVGKMILPFLGGTASVWTTAVLFFQLMLLGGYFYANRLSRFKSLRTQLAVHLGLMTIALAFLPFRFNSSELTSEFNRSPVLWELFHLLKTTGIPYFVISTTAPLLQGWLSRTNDASARDPYFLYAASNTGSLLALLVYPFLIEPEWGVRQQNFYWMMGYLVLVFFGAALAMLLWRARSTTIEVQPSAEPPPDLKQKAFWLVAAFVPSGLLLGVTAHISVNLTPMPLVWTIPMAVYLSTFILAFGRRIRVSSTRVGQLSLPVLILFCPAIGIQVPVTLGVDVVLMAIHMTLLFMASLLCHTALAEQRPGAQYLTDYYVWMALGGVLGGVFAAIVSPWLFRSIFEYPLLLAAAVFFYKRNGKTRWVVSAALACLVLGYALYLPRQLAEKGDRVHVTRNFFGVKKVIDNGQERRLLHGDTLHGVESRDPSKAGEPLSYYHREGPLGDVMRLMGDTSRQHVGVIGLGAGSIAAYASPYRHVTFFEIDPDVEFIAGRYFGFLSRCAEHCNVVSGDGRLSVARFPERTFDLLILDAFSSDVIPPHLLSRQALELYISRLKPNGALLFHVSNRYLRVKDLVSALVTAEGMSALTREDNEDKTSGKSHSIYVVAAPLPHLMGKLDSIPGWQDVRTPAGFRVWTDDYSSIADLLQW